MNLSGLDFVKKHNEGVLIPQVFKSTFWKVDLGLTITAMFPSPFSKREWEQELGVSFIIWEREHSRFRNIDVHENGNVGHVSIPRLLRV